MATVKVTEKYGSVAKVNACMTSLFIVMVCIMTFDLLSCFDVEFVLPSQSLRQTTAAITIGINKQPTKIAPMIALLY